MDRSQQILLNNLEQIPAVDMTDQQWDTYISLAKQKKNDETIGSISAIGISILYGLTYVFKGLFIIITIVLIFSLFVSLFPWSLFALILLK